MGDKFTSTSGKLLYKARFSPGGETMFIESSGAVNAHEIARGAAYFQGIVHTGCDVMLATENEITDYLGQTEEE